MQSLNRSSEKHNVGGVYNLKKDEHIFVRFRNCLSFSDKIWYSHYPDASAFFGFQSIHWKLRTGQCVDLSRFYAAMGRHRAKQHAAPLPGCPSAAGAGRKPTSSAMKAQKKDVRATPRGLDLIT